MKHELTPEIKPTYVTFEQAKLFKEKRFNEKCSCYYGFNGKLKNNQFDAGWFVNNTMVRNQCTAPEQWQAVEWLLIKHGIWVFTDPVFDFSEWTSTVVIKGSVCALWRSEGYKTPQHAYSAAFDHILKNTI